MCYMALCSGIRYLKRSDLFVPQWRVLLIWMSRPGAEFAYAQRGPLKSAHGARRPLTPRQITSNTWTNKLLVWPSRHIINQIDNAKSIHIITSEANCYLVTMTRFYISFMTLIFGWLWKTSAWHLYILNLVLENVFLIYSYWKIEISE